MTIESVLNGLEAVGKVKKAGAQKWRSACPVHGGKHLNLIVSERTDGSVGAHCFVCNANGVELVKSLGLEMKDIFAPDSSYQAPMISRKMQTEETQDRLVLAMAEAQASRGIPISLTDKRRIKMANARLEGIENLRREQHLGR